MRGLKPTICTASLGENEGCVFMCVGLLSCRLRRSELQEKRNCFSLPWNSADVCRPLRSLHTHTERIIRGSPCCWTLLCLFSFSRDHVKMPWEVCLPLSTFSLPPYFLAATELSILQGSVLISPPWRRSREWEAFGDLIGSRLMASLRRLSPRPFSSSLLLARTCGFIASDQPSRNNILWWQAQQLFCLLSEFLVHLVIWYFSNILQDLDEERRIDFGVSCGRCCCHGSRWAAPYPCSHLSGALARPSLHWFYLLCLSMGVVKDSLELIM